MMDLPAPCDERAIGALKAIGKTLGQMTLYRVGHPAVGATLQESHRLLTELLSASPSGEAAFAIDGDRLLANGRVIGSAALVPNAIVTLFNRFRLNSITFKAGLADTELMSLCKLAGLRAEQAKGVDAAAFLSERGVARIGLNEAIYAKVEKAGETPLPVQAGGGTEASGAPAQPTAPPMMERIAGIPIERSIEALVQEAVKDPGDREAVYQAVLRRLRTEVETRVREATESLKREKTQLENEQTRTQAVLSNIAEGVVVVDDHGRVLMMNPAAEDLYGVKLGDVAGKPLAERVKEEHLLAMASEIVTPQDRPIQTEVEVLSTEDTRRAVRASTAVVQNEAGKPVGMVSVLTDVSKHKELDRMEHEFVAHVTHELRSPLSSIRASLEILERQLVGKLADEDARIFLTALKNTDRLEDLIKGILDFSKIESGRMTVHPEAEEAERLAREGVDSLHPWAKRKGVELTLAVEPGLPQVGADAGRTVQVLVNLLSNAIKFTPAGGRISVRAGRGTGRHERYVLFSISDTGPGIAKEHHAKVFEKFIQIAAGERHVGGTGLGLAIAKALIHLQTGQLWLESELGKGATFYFTLPFYIPKEERQPPQAPAPKTPWWKRLFGAR